MGAHPRFLNREIGHDGFGDMEWMLDRQDVDKARAGEHLNYILRMPPLTPQPRCVRLRLELATLMKLLLVLAGLIREHGYVSGCPLQKDR